ncbi:hypothetical protein ACQ86N_41990 [Puia sp. P3]|uniref:hypothetical protein n=1 Tax=Puia sp. P3 TaxID=3423952 RepID=UPI003D66C90C
MKESNFYSDDFEQLIREKTEQYKMYPSEKVWKGVHGSLHTKRKWFIGSMALLVGGILFFAGRELIAPSAHPVLATKGLAASDSGAALSRIVLPASTHRHPALAALHAPNNTTPAARHYNGADDPTGNEDNQSPKGITITLSNLVISQPDLSEFLSRAVALPDHAPAIPVIAAKTIIPAGGGSSDAAAARLTRGGSEPEQRGAAADATDDITAQSVLESLSARTEVQARNKRDLAHIRSGNSSLAKGRLADSASGATRASATAIAESGDRARINWLHDYALYTLAVSQRQSRTYFQLTLSPTVNYRSLSGGDYGLSKYSGPANLVHTGDAQRYVDHSPALGFQVGGSVLYRVTRNLSIKGGLQFNFSRYMIKAYATNDPQPATITLSSYYGYVMDSLTAYTRMGNFGGRTQETFSNDYYQLSAPVGFELRVLGNERLQFNIGATIQPSYLLNTNAYMLSSDYQSYLKAPTLFRRWNINGGVEAFMTYKLNGVTLQAGPEFRYQLLSTYTNQYPITENLKGFGFKLGIVKELP